MNACIAAAAIKLGEYFLRKVSASMFNVVLAFEDKPFLDLPPSNANSVFPEASVTTKLIAKFARAGGKLRSPASAVNFSTKSQTNHQLKMQA